ncbi:MAG: organic solvent tolerance protein OstA [Bacteroidales bacterium]|nr:organic solvent tolerance protein OstA [Bacteroidales bacterium]
MNNSVFGQKTIIHIEKARLANYDKRLGIDIQRLIGNVVLRQDSTLFYCDSAYLNDKLRNFEAFGHVHINFNDSLDIYSKRLKYEGESRIAELFDSVRMVDKTMVLVTDYLIYNRTTRIASYPNNGTITNQDKILKSKKGFYHTDTKEFYFRDDVELISPDNTAYSDTLVYNSQSEIAWFHGPTVIRGKDNTIYTEYGWYDTKQDHAHLSRRAKIWNDEQMLESDQLFYNRDIGFGDAKGNVLISDTANNMLISGDIGKMWELEGRSFVTGKAMARSYDEKDTLFMHADTLFLTFNKKEKQARDLYAYKHVKFFRKDMQGKCDSLVYHMSDSAMRMYIEPVLWSQKNQLTADSILIAISKNSVDSLVMYNTAFIVSHDSIENYNQIKGKNMTGYFVDNELKRIYVDGNAQTVYWVREEDKSLIGTNLAKASTMLIRLHENEIESITYRSNPNEVMYPEKELPNDSDRLKGFRWLSEWRPLVKSDIFVIGKREIEIPKTEEQKPVNLQLLNEGEE